MSDIGDLASSALLLLLGVIVGYFAMQTPEYVAGLSFLAGWLFRSALIRRKP